MLTGILAIILYLTATFLLVRQLLRPASERPGRNTIITLGLAAVALHGAGLYTVLFRADGIDLGFFNALSLIFWLISLVLLISAYRRPLGALCVPFLLLAAVSIALAMSIASQHVLLINVAWQLQVHIIVSIFAYSILTIAIVQAALLAIQDRRLRNHRPGGLIRVLPPLQDMESFLFQLIAIGFILLTISLLTGTLFIDDMFARHLAHKTVLSIIAWTIFLVLLWGRYRLGWRGKTAMRWTLWGFLTLMLAYLGSKLVLELILQRVN